MWRFVQKGLKCGKAVKAPCIAVYSDDPQSSPCPVRKFSSSWATDSKQFRSNYEDSGGGGQNHEWKQCMNACHFDFWTRPGCRHFIEAVGWGSAVITGFQVTDLCRRSNGRVDEEHRCWFQNVIKRISQLGLTRLSDLFTNYTYSFLSIHTISRSVLPSKYIVPARQPLSRDTQSSSPRTSSVDADCHLLDGLPEIDLQIEPDLEKDSVDLRASQRDGSSSVDRNESLTFSACKTDLSDFGAMWRRLVEQHVAAIHSNVDALRRARRGDLDAAVQLWTRACDSSMCTPVSMFNLAVCYEQGFGVDQNLNKAADLYSKAAELGHAKSAFNLASMILKNSTSDEDTKRAVDLLEKASEKGLKEAQRELGVLYTEQPRRDMVKAAKLFEMAAERKDASAAYYLGICYERGLGVDQNTAKAAQLYKLSSDLGCRDAFYSLAVFFEHGMGGLPLDLFEAIRYYKTALNLGVDKAAEKLTSLERQHPLLMVAMADVKAEHLAENTRAVESSGSHDSLERKLWMPFTQLFASLSSDSDVDMETSSVSSSDGSSSCSAGKPRWRVGNSRMDNDDATSSNRMLRLRCSTSDVDDDQSSACDLDVLIEDFSFDVPYRHTLSTRSVDNIDATYRGAYQKVSVPHVSSFG